MSIDELLSSGKLLSIAEKENKTDIRNMCDLLFGIADLLSFVFVIFPLYPNAVSGFVYSVNLFDYTQISQFGKALHWIMIALLFLSGVVKLILTRTKAEKINKFLTEASIVTGVFMVVFLTLTREAYAVIVAFLLLLIKGVLLFRHIKSR